MSTLQADPSASNGVREFRRLLEVHLHIIDQMVRSERNRVKGVEPDDVGHEAVLFLLERERHYRPDTQFLHWVVFAVRRVVSTLRKTRGWASDTIRRAYWEDGSAPRHVAHEEAISSATGRQEVQEEPLLSSRRRVRKAILQLVPAYRKAVLVAHWREPDSLIEYDRETGRPPGFTSEKLYYARKRLRKLLAA